MLKVKKNGDRAWVTFTYKPQKDVKSVKILGNWNDWKEESLKKKKNGDFYITKILPIGRIYEFRYFIDGKYWENDVDAMEVQNSFGGFNSAIEV